MEENKTAEVTTEVTETKKEKKVGFLDKVKNFVTNPAKGRPIKNAGFMLGGAGVLMLVASLMAGKREDSDPEPEEIDEE